MHLPSLTALASLALASALSLTINVPASPPSLPNPNTLPPSTHATLSSLSTSASAPLTDRNTFVFRNLTQGSYLLDIHAPTHAFIPLRVDVAADGTLYAWETHRGNDWENKGEALPALDFGVRGGEGQRGFNARVIGGKAYFVERSKCTLRSLFPDDATEEDADLLFDSQYCQYCDEEPHDPDGSGHHGPLPGHALPDEQQYVTPAYPQNPERLDC